MTLVDNPRIIFLDEPTTGLPIAEYQPFTPVIETLRGLLLGSEIGHNGWFAIAWCLGLTVLGYFWSTSASPGTPPGRPVAAVRSTNTAPFRPRRPRRPPPTQSRRKPPVPVSSSLPALLTHTSRFARSEHPSVSLG